MGTTFWVEGHEHDDLEIHVAMGNAPTVIRLLGLEGADPQCGRVPVESLPRVLRHLIKVRNSANLIQGEVLEDLHEGNFHSFGRTEDQVLRYTSTLMRICEGAIRIGKPLVWG